VSHSGPFTWRGTRRFTGHTAKQWTALIDRDSVRMAEMTLDQKPDVFLLGGSVTLTLGNPALVRQYALPAIKTIPFYPTAP